MNSRNGDKVMNSTDELRKWASVEVPYKYGHQLNAIADRIDVEHQKALDERDSERFNALMDAREKGVNAVLKEPEGFGLTALPKDADNVQWRIGEKDENGSEVIAFNLVSDGWYVITDSGWSFRSEKHRHYHVPTVEDLIRDTILQCVGHLPEYWDESIAECAAKLQLKED